MTGNRIGRLAMILGAAGLLAGCQEGGGGMFSQRPAASEAAPGTPPELIEREVEAPEVFSATESALWDGRPSLGGVWVAHPGAKDPQRVLIRNTENGKSVVGALFRREREMPGPNFQVSSDAAAALGLLAGNPTELSVVALRIEEVPETPPEPEEIAEPEPIEEAPIKATPLAAAAAAIEKAEAAESAPRPAPRPERPAPVARGPAMSPEQIVAPPPGEVALPKASGMAAAAPEAPKPAPAPRPRLFQLQKPFIQVGIFNDAANAEETGEQLRKAGIVPNIYDQERDGARFWRVVIGPSRNRPERKQLLEQVQGLGYTDAYYVTN